MRAATIPLESVGAIASTSDELKARADRGAGEAALMARSQTAGRGRLGRAWHSIDGNLYLSVLLRPARPVSPGHWSLLAAVALADTVARSLPEGAPLRLKWPNDVMLDGGKLAGILLDAGADQAGQAWLVLGFGVNLAAAPDGLGRPTASLAAHGPQSPADFAPRLLATLSCWRHRYEANGFPPVRQRWTSLGPRVGDPVAAGAGPSRVAGTFAGIGADGSMLLHGPAGPMAVTSGEVD